MPTLARGGGRALGERGAGHGAHSVTRRSLPSPPPPPPAALPGPWGARSRVGRAHTFRSSNPAGVSLCANSPPRIPPEPPPRVFSQAGAAAPLPPPRHPRGTADPAGTQIAQGGVRRASLFFVPCKQRSTSGEDPPHRPSPPVPGALQPPLCKRQRQPRRATVKKKALKNQTKPNQNQSPKTGKPPQ